jgi:AraC-like DNA-binding protein
VTTAIDERLVIDRRLAGMVWHYHHRGQLFPMHTHRELELNLVLRGRGTCLMDDRRYDLQRNSMVWLFRGQPHVLLNQSADLEMWIVVWRPSLVRRYGPGELRPARPRGEFNRIVGEAPASRLSTLIGEVESSLHDPLRCNLGLAYLLRCAWAVHEGTTALTLGVEVHPAVERAARALSANPELALRDAARLASISESRLRHLFRRQAGVSLVAYRNRRRIDRFISLYGDGRQETMLSAALRAGFGSYVQFHRVFRGVFGQSPRQWQTRRSNRGSR